jgi:hypothetical protein
LFEKLVESGVVERNGQVLDAVHALAAPETNKIKLSSSKYNSL